MRTAAPCSVHRVLAGPGSGKTRLIIGWLLERLRAGAPASSLLGITFTRKAAQEMRDRLAGSGVPAPRLSTFHALARRILVDLNRCPDPFDLDTLIPRYSKVLRSGLAPAWVRDLTFLAVDEAQDLDRSQVEFLTALRAHAANAELLLVGDPDQAIYGFRQASAEYLLHAERYFPPPIRTLCLSENHRSARQIVEAARILLTPIAPAGAPCRTLAPARPEAHPAIRQVIAASPAEEAQRIFEEVRTFLALGIPAREIAILIRTRAQGAILRQEARRCGVETYTPPSQEGVDGSGPLEDPRHPATAVSLLTMHQAKGSEWTVVFLAGCQAGIAPSPSAVTPAAQAEEVRLLYVAVTRAKQLLWLCRHGAPAPCLVSVLTAFAAPGSRPRSSLQRLRAWLQRACQPAAPPAGGSPQAAEVI